MPITVRRLRTDEADALRRIRLAALLDAPSAFGSTHAAEVGLDRSHWEGRARRHASGDDDATFVAELDGRPVGLVSAYRPGPTRPQRELVSMWTSPPVRRTGTARRLVDAVVGWATSAGATAVELWVTEGNEPAIALYRAAGFVDTGQRQPLPSDPSLDERRMRRSISSAALGRPSGTGTRSEGGTTMATTITTIRTVAIPSQDQDRSVAFYVERLGFEVRTDVEMSGGFRWIEVAPPGSDVTLAIMPAGDELPAGVDTGIRFVTGDARGEHTSMTGRGVDPGELLDWPDAPLMFHFKDPDGNTLYLVEG